MAELTIDVSRLSHFELPARVLSALTLPQPEEVARREARTWALCAVVLRVCADDLAAAHNRFLVSAKVASMEERAICRELRSFRADLRRSLEAARIAAPFVAEWTGNYCQLAPNSTRPLSINAMLNLRPGGLRALDDGNAKARIWRQFRPVIHLGIAMSRAIGSYEAKFGHSLSDFEFMWRPLLAMWVMRESIFLERDIGQIPKLQPAHSELLRIRLTESGVTNHVGS